ncbi:S1/P1 nuclease [Marivirga sp. S37H4]|uniref:S1/P1 nuclease n=1 Tax=Marivirga aurantiaca TaxID=2802615 RepID=A0A934WZ07_9BACT|nr:S1/P1 nuclease [Marivirga aurantiaca]MBK6265808.1 S1/P1 nuclease [Marivirga aurantiaca]
MRIKIISTFLLMIFFLPQAFSWGQTGHRAIGEVASFYITKKTQKKIEALLGGESLAIASVWMDEVKSDDAYDHTHDWHWVEIPNGMTYAESKKNPDGDIIMTIERLVKELKAGNLDRKTEQEHLKMLLHLVGDIHQPCHVGNGEDQGSNKVWVKWFGKNSNLHKVWDSEMIDGKQLSYTELANAVNLTTKEQVKEWQQNPLDVWVQEAIALRPQIYDFNEDNNLRYEYAYKNWDTLQQQLLKAGVRLAGVLNDIYG